MAKEITVYERGIPKVISIDGPQEVAYRDPNQKMVYDITPSATQVVRVDTSAVDRAKGFQIQISTLAGVLAFLVLVLAIFYRNVELWSLIALVIFWVSFCVIYVIGWGLTMILTAEFVSLFEACMKWFVVIREQNEAHRSRKR